MIYIVERVFFKIHHALFVIFFVCNVETFFFKIDTLRISFFCVRDKFILAVYKIRNHLVLSQFFEKLRKYFLHINFHIMRQRVGRNGQRNPGTDCKSYFFSVYSQFVISILSIFRHCTLRAYKQKNYLCAYL